MGDGLFDYSVKSGPDLLRLRLGLVKLVTRSTKARFGQVGDHVSQVKDQVGQGQGQELDNCWFIALLRANKKKQLSWLIDFIE